MICIFSNTTDPYLNFAYEDYLLSEFEESFLFIYRNSESIIIGRNQIIAREINNKAVFENNIPVIRRKSGGGTVFNDIGNVNMSFIVSRGYNTIELFSRLICSFFKKDGIYLNYNSTGAIFFNKDKISGSAQYYRKKRVIHHATLLLNSDLEKLNNCLDNKNYNKYSSNAQASKKAKVVNLKDIADINYDSLLKKLKLEINTLTLENVINKHDSSIKENIEKFRDVNWLNRQPNYSFQNCLDFNGETINLRFDVKNNFIFNYECDNINFAKTYNLNGLKHDYCLMKNSEVCKNIIEYIF